MSLYIAGAPKRTLHYIISMNRNIACVFGTLTLRNVVFPYILVLTVTGDISVRVAE
jgi:hypothetical protein